MRLIDADKMLERLQEWNTSDDMDIDEIIEQIADYLIENSEDIISLLKEKERDELADLIYTEITEE